MSWSETWTASISTQTSQEFPPSLLPENPVHRMLNYIAGRIHDFERSFVFAAVLKLV
jgi:hypothetical protein